MMHNEEVLCHHLEELNLTKFPPMLGHTFQLTIILIKLISLFQGIVQTVHVADADTPQLAKELAAPGASNSIMPLAPILDDSNGPQDPVDMAAAEATSGAVRIAAADAPDSAVSHFSLAGFCPVSFVKRSGLLMKADTSLGFVRYEL